MARDHLTKSNNSAKTPKWVKRTHAFKTMTSKWHNYFDLDSVMIVSLSCKLFLKTAKMLYRKQTENLMFATLSKKKAPSFTANTGRTVDVNWTENCQNLKIRWRLSAYLRQLYDQPSSLLLDFVACAFRQQVGLILSNAMKMYWHYLKIFHVTMYEAVHYTQQTKIYVFIYTKQWTMVAMMMTEKCTSHNALRFQAMKCVWFVLFSIAWLCSLSLLRTAAASSLKKTSSMMKSDTIN